MNGDWRKPRSRSLEDFVKWVFKVLIMLAVVVMTWRYVLTADASTPPWQSLPLIHRL